MNVVFLGYRTDLALLERAGSTIEDCGDHLVVLSPSNRARPTAERTLAPRSDAAASVVR